ncbi:TetR family transcriptional regulator [Streptomyces sp. NRRL F-4489]|uniref:TetR/AcrR family transcriptional regulator n=1 Tax=Streptomyces sp. NRRL F-4489 TaxID=1609095 RepID=UPI000748CD8C|nr:TetR/AcrR family transcriptional regulator [Streptomyces sp. NRRL F-4489]KUL55375.1 TetR family transcriptional regulator [Streptomyces sp. NRRL F-4489]
MADESSLRERLIDVGVDLVLQEGSASVGLREIARRAGVSHGAPRRYFPTHRALLSAIARRGFEDLGARFEVAVAGAASATPRGRLEALARAYVAYALERRGMFELMFRHDLLDSAPEASDQPRLRESTLPLFGQITDLVARCRSERDAAERDGASHGAVAPLPAVAAAALWANLHGIAQLWAWGSLQLAVNEAELGNGAAGGHVDGDGQRDRLIAAVLDAHLGPVTA